MLLGSQQFQSKKNVKEVESDGCSEPRRMSKASLGRARETEHSLGKEMGSSKDKKALVAPVAINNE